MHYTTQQPVFDSFNASEYIIKKSEYLERFDQIDKYYKRNHVRQDNLPIFGYCCCCCMLRY